MAALHELDEMLKNLSVSRRAGTWTLVSLPEPVPLSAEVAAVISESEGTTAVVTTDEADRRSWPYEFVAAWLTLEIHSALDGVGLTAAVSKALAENGIPANMLAGYFHDHILVPVDQATVAMDAIEQLAASRPSSPRGETGS